MPAWLRYGMLGVVLLAQTRLRSQLPPQISDSQVTAALKRAKELDYRHPIAHSTELSPNQRAELMRLADKEFRPDAADPDYKSEDQIRQYEAATRFELVDLDGDAAPEVILQPTGGEYCGATGNCDLVVFKRTPHGYRHLLSGVSAQLVGVESHRTGGYRDLLIAVHDSASKKDVSLYQYRSGSYRQVACWNANWVDMAHGSFNVRKNPIITPHRCRKD